MSERRDERPGGARRLLRSALLACIAVLYLVSIPWYRAGGAEAPTWWGLPDWVAVALGCYALTALLNALAWGLTDVPDAPPEAARAHADARPPDAEGS